MHGRGGGIAASAAMAEGTMIEGLALAPSVHAVIVDDHAVFLDVDRDRYFKLGRHQTQTLTEAQTPARERLLAQLVNKGLAASGQTPSADDGSPRATERAVRSAGGALAVVGACQWAATALRTRPFRHILQWAHDARPVAANKCNDLLARFLSRRPLYARDYNCLFDSLALIRFLRLRGAAGDWVFGVRGAPFAAHCWVELDGAAVNDDPEFVAPYTSILIL